MNKLYLFYPDGAVGRLIKHVTGSPFSHAAIEYNGVIYDASEERGDFNVSHIKPETRKHIVIEFAGDLSGWLARMTGKKYDWPGVLGWVFAANSKKRVYCFEAAWQALKDAGVVSGVQPRRLSGSDLLAAVIARSSLTTVESIIEAKILVDLVCPGLHKKVSPSVFSKDVISAVVYSAWSVADAADSIEAIRIISSSDEITHKFEEMLMEIGPISAEISKI